MSRPISKSSSVKASRVVHAKVASASKKKETLKSATNKVRTSASIDFVRSVRH